MEIKIGNLVSITTVTISKISDSVSTITGTKISVSKDTSSITSVSKNPETSDYVRDDTDTKPQPNSAVLNEIIPENPVSKFSSDSARPLVNK